MKTLSELLNVDSSWPIIRRVLEEGSQEVEVKILPVNRRRAEEGIYRIQQSVRTALGAICFNTGGVLVDGGWLRILGGGSLDGSLPSVADFNVLPAEFTDGELSGFFSVAYDVLGGKFALITSKVAADHMGGRLGQVCYFSPDALEWELMDFGYGDWLHWAVSGRLDQFYSGLRWDEWRRDVDGLPLNFGISVVPFLWTMEAQGDINKTTRKPVDISEIFSLNIEFSQQFND